MASILRKLGEVVSAYIWSMISSYGYCLNAGEIVKDGVMG